jgi:hypothetical protein
VHCTLVIPAVNIDPDWRVQLTCTGATPPVVVGCANEMATDVPSRATDEVLPGQLMLKDGGGATGVSGGTRGVGEVGDPPHPDSASTRRPKTRCVRAFFTGRGRGILSKRVRFSGHRTGSNRE